MKIIFTWHYIAAVFGIISFLIRRFLQKNPDTAESVYSQSVYPVISQWVSLPARWLPSVSVSEIFIFLTVVLLIILTVRSIVLTFRIRKFFLTRMLRALCHVTAVLCIVFGLYLWLWGYNYLRQPFSASMNLNDPVAVAPADAEQFADDMTALVNGFSNKKTDQNRQEVPDQIVCEAIIRTISTYMTSSRLPVCTPAKTLFANEILNVFGISGIFLPICHEPHINSTIADWEAPFITAHEKAHAMGFASETDANIIAYISCLLSESERMRYSGALKLLVSLRSRMTSDEWMKRIYSRLSDNAQQDIADMNQRIWKNFHKYQKTVTVSSYVNDAYLKLNHQKLGVRSYGAALPFVIIWWNTGVHNNTAASK